MSTINKSTLDFLNAIAINNNRDWFNKNKPAYENAKQNVKSFIKDFYQEFSKVDHLESMKFYRIYRDIRFSKDKTPYKNNFGVGFTRATSLLRGGYYLHLQPGASFVGGGFWGPNPGDLLRIRKEFEFDVTPFRKIIDDNTFRKYFGSLEGSEVKTAPRGFRKDHPAIDLIRKKQLVVKRSFTDQEALSHTFQTEILSTYKAMLPFLNYMSEVLTTDLNGERIG